jgi:hypothetical protein
MRLREAGVTEETIADILWHRRKSMTAHYSMGQLVEIHQALLRIENETHGWNLSLMSLVRNQEVLRKKLPTQENATQAAYA